MRAAGAMLFAAALVSVGACTFPDVSYSTGPDAAGSDDVNTTDSPTTSGDGGGDASMDALADGIADVIAADVSDATTDANPCDQDGDGYLAQGPTCNGDDCCDHDSSAHPKQTAWFTMADTCGSFDYNCNGKEDQEYATNVVCSGAIVCSSAVGFSGSPSCGTSGPYITCGQQGLSCVATGQSTQTQACN